MQDNRKENRSVRSSAVQHMITWIQDVVTHEGQDHPAKKITWLPAQLIPTFAHLFEDYKADHAALCLDHKLDSEQ